RFGLISKSIRETWGWKRGETGRAVHRVLRFAAVASLFSCNAFISVPDSPFHTTTAPAPTPTPQQPPQPQAPPQTPERPVVFHTHVANAHFWLDGALVPAVDLTTGADGDTPAFTLPANISAFNVHATAAGYGEYGVVAHVTAQDTPLDGFFGDCPGGCTAGTHEVFVGPKWDPNVML